MAKGSWKSPKYFIEVEMVERPFNFTFFMEVQLTTNILKSYSIFDAVSQKYFLFRKLQLVLNSQTLLASLFFYYFKGLRLGDVKLSFEEQIEEDAICTTWAEFLGKADEVESEGLAFAEEEGGDKWDGGQIWFHSKSIKFKDYWVNMIINSIYHLLYLFSEAKDDDIFVY